MEDGTVSIFLATAPASAPGSCRIIQGEIYNYQKPLCHLVIISLPRETQTNHSSHHGAAATSAPPPRRPVQLPSSRPLRAQPPSSPQLGFSCAGAWLPLLPPPPPPSSSFPSPPHRPPTTPTTPIPSLPRPWRSRKQPLRTILRLHSCTSWSATATWQ